MKGFWNFYRQAQCHKEGRRHSSLPPRKRRKVKQKKKKKRKKGKTGEKREQKE